MDIKQFAHICPTSPRCQLPPFSLTAAVAAAARFRLWSFGNLQLSRSGAVWCKRQWRSGAACELCDLWTLNDSPLLLATLLFCAVLFCCCSLSFDLGSCLVLRWVRNSVNLARNVQKLSVVGHSRNEARGRQDTENTERRG